MSSPHTPLVATVSEALRSSVDAGATAEGWTALVAVAIALAGLYWQARSQAQTARLALFHKRLDLYKEVRALIVAGGAKRGHSVPRFYRSKTRRSPDPFNPSPAEVVADALETVNSVRDDIRFLFGEDVGAYVDEVRSTAFWVSHHLGVVHEDVARTDEEQRRVLLRLFPHEKRLRNLGERLESTFAPYLEEDRLSGVSYRHKAKLAANRREQDREWAMRALPPYVPGEPE